MKMNLSQYTIHQNLIQFAKASRKVVWYPITGLRTKCSAAFGTILLWLGDFALNVKIPSESNVKNGLPFKVCKISSELLDTYGSIYKTIMKNNHLCKALPSACHEVTTIA